MEKLKISYHLLHKALATLQASFFTIKEAESLHNQPIIEATQDSCIQRFEYCYDSFGNF